MHSHKFLFVSVLDTTSLVGTDMCKEEYILSIPGMILRGGGGGGGGGGVSNSYPEINGDQ